ncbi:peptidoglycan-binding protein [Streptomyces sp. NBC_00487]|uniref:peptidoglycan-binding domain-containing protein n=1 Tax=unclassified Streptomyces TaxID=2593676 RepID=UPI002E1897A3|nr:MULTISPECIES: peptidoglycan-binding domain-containing protein [unclassified Streptomyces]
MPFASDASAGPDRPSPHSLSPSPSPSPASPSAGRPGRRRRRRTGLIAALAGTAAAGVMAAAGLASGLFSYDAPERDRALPDDLRASAPDTSPDGEASPVEPPAEGGGGAPAPAPPGGGAASPSPTKSPSPSPSPSQPSGSPSASASASPTQSAPSAGASGGSSAAGADDSDDSRLVVPQTLRVGDDDPEVTELQLRLNQLGLYNGDIDQNYDSQVEQAVLFYQSTRGITKDKEEPGVYGLVTRERLESETKEP